MGEVDGAVSVKPKILKKNHGNTEEIPNLSRHLGMKIHHTKNKGDLGVLKSQVKIEGRNAEK